MQNPYRQKKKKSNSNNNSNHSSSNNSNASDENKNSLNNSGNIIKEKKDNQMAESEQSPKNNETQNKTEKLNQLKNLKYIFPFFNETKEDDNTEIELLTNETEKIKSVLLEKMELFGKEYNVNQKILKKRMGKLPCTDIEKVEKQIKLIEKDFENKKINMDMVNQLMSLYQKAVEYFSAINSPEFKIYTDKIKELMKTQKIHELIDKSNEEKKIIDNNINSQITKKRERKRKRKRNYYFFK